MTSVPAKLADEIEALGWQVERVKEGATRTVAAMRGEHRVAVVFERRESRGPVPYRDVFVEAWHIVDEKASKLRSTAHALGVVKGLPFALDAPADKIMAALAGRTIEWSSRVTDKTQRGDVPRGGLHLKLAGSEDTAPEDRVLHFTDDRGFRAVRLGAIVAVK